MGGTLNTLVAARDEGVQTFVFASSSSVYGNTEVLPKTEDMRPSPRSPYAVQKLTGEFYCRLFHQLYGLRTYCLRFFNVFGPRQNPKSQYAAVVPLFIMAVKEGKAPLIHGDGDQTRDFTFVADVVAAHMTCCTASGGEGDVYNIGYGGRTSINELAELIVESMGKKDIKPVHDDPRKGDVRDSQACLDKIGQALGWKPGVELKDGLERTIEYFVHGRS